MSFVRPIIQYLLCLVPFFVGMVSAADDNYRLNLSRVDIREDIADFHVVDLDGDGDDDFVELFGNRRGYMARPFNRERIIGPALYQANFQYRISSITPIDIDSLPGTEIAVALRDNEGDSIWINIVSGSDPKRVLCRTEAIHGENISDRSDDDSPGWDGHIPRCYLADLDHDGMLEIVTSLTVSFDLYPRGVYVYTYPEGKRKWWFPTAGVPLDLSFADANGDSLLEIYFKTWACYNGAVVDGRADTAAYAFALNHAGDVIWMTELGDRFDRQTGNIHLCDCDRDDTLEAYYTILLRGDEYDRHVRILEKHRAEDNFYLHQRSFDADHRYREIQSADMDGDGLLDLIVNDRPSVLDPRNLSTIREGTLNLIDIALIEDVYPPADEYPEIVIKKKDSLYILNNRLHILARYGTEQGGHIRQVRYFRTPFGRHCLGVVVNINSLGTPGSIVYLLEMTPAESPSGLTVFLGAYRLFWPTVLSAFVLGMPIGVILYRWYLRRRRRRQPKTEQFVDLLGALATFDHGQTAGKNLNRLSFLFANLPIDSGKLEEIRPNLAAAVEAYHSFTSLQLDEILRQAKRIKIMRPIMNGLEKQVRRLDDLLHDLQVKELIVENGRAPEPSLPSVIDKLQIGIKQIGKCVQANLSTDLTELLPRVIVILNARMRQQRVGFREVISRGGGRFPVFFAERELAVIIEELFTNAFIAMTDSPVKELSMYIEATNGEIVFKLSDTGCGLKSEDPNAVFSREYSTKDEGGGYGLYHVRQEVERFGGRVRIRNNANGPGATVQIYFKTVKNE